MNLDKLLHFEFPTLEYRLTARDAIVYALGICIGDRPQDERDLQFVYEKGLRVFPSQANVICHPAGWAQDPAFEIDWVKMLHGEQRFELHKALEPERTYTGSYKVVGVVDKGVGRGALLYIRKELREKNSNALVSTVDSTLFLRGDGGSGGTMKAPLAPHPIPERVPDSTILLATTPATALLYRLSGDYNPIHADPALARKAGFERPILHGLCTLGIATRAMLRACCNDSSDRLRSLQLRFTAPVYPGETLVTEIWYDGNAASFRTKVADRNVVVLDNGRANFGRKSEFA